MGRFYVLRDLKSTNGTWVNQNPIRTHILKHGDVVRLGNSRLVVQVSAESAEMGEEHNLEKDDCHTKIIDSPFAFDSSPESRHTLRLNVSKEGVQFPSGKKLQERLLKLHEISKKIGFIETPTILCGQVVEIVLKELKADRATILVPEGDELCTIAARVSSPELGQPFNIHYGVLRNAIDERTAILTENAAKDQRFQADSEQSAENIGSVMCVPLVAQNNLQGLIYVDRISNSEPFTEDDLRFLAVISNQVAINLANARLFEEILLEKQKVQAVVSSLKDGLVITDQGLFVQSCNAAAARILFQELSGSLEGENLQDLLLDRDPSLDENELQSAIREGKEFQIHIQRNSDVRAYIVSVAPFIPGEGDQAGYAFSFRDTTDLLHLQQLKSEFICNASHKLRTPLTVIMGSLDLMRSLSSDEEEGEDRTLLIEGMKKNLEQFQGLVTRFLEFAELDRARYRLREIDLQEVVAVASSGISPQAVEKKIQVLNNIPRGQPLLVQGDLDRLVQCLHNVLENAVKFAPEESQVRVQSEMEDGWIKIHIEDEGPGIPAEDLQDIFSGFHQVEKMPTGEVPGAGLGLTITKRIIHAHQGSITAVSPVPSTDKGTLITISLPRPESGKASEVQAPSMQSVEVR